MSGRYNQSRELFTRHMQHAHAHGPDEYGVIILNILEVVMSAIDSIQQEFDAYKQTVADTFAAQDQALSSALAKMTDLQTQLQNAGVDPAQAQALADDITAAQQAAQAELARVQQAAAAPATPATGAGGPATDPAGGTAATPDPSAGTTPAGGGSAGPSGAAPAGPTTTPGAAKTLYLTTEDPATVDVSAWPPSGLETAPTDGSAAQPLYTYVGDVNPGDQNGTQVAGWTVYDGPTQPVPAA